MDYYQGYQEGYLQARSNARYYSIGGWLVQTVLSLIYLAVVLLPLLMIAYTIAETISITYSNNPIIKIGLTLGFTYLLYSILYVLKGVMIGLRDIKHKMWIPIWIVCIIFTCGLQILISQYQLQDYFNSKNVANSPVWSWLGSMSLGILIYSHYSFLTNIAPRSVFWAYKTGFYLGSVFGAKPTQNVPEKSRTLFGNAQMKVSFRKR
jgi:hypothetical protein